MNRILCGDVLSFCRHYKGLLFHGVLCDPPYGLSFMGKDWDHGVPGVPYWKAIRSLCRPGAWLLAFGGTKTHHRLMVAIEDAGWELRDTVMYVYGSGFPKSMSISKAIDKAAGAEREVVGRKSDPRYQYDFPESSRPYQGKTHHDWSNDETSKMANITAPATEAAKQWSGYGTALKPSFEPIILAMNPRDGTFANNALEHGCGGLWIDGCRVEYENTANPATNPLYRIQNGYRTRVGSDADGSSFSIKPEGGDVTAHPQGRWPANLIHDGSEEVVGLFPKTKGGTWNRTKGARHFNNNGEPTGYETSKQDASEGSAARFFYCAKASKAERNAGLDGMEKKSNMRVNAPRKSEEAKHANKMQNHHPTVKNLSLTEYLARLILPPEQDEPRRIFCPFAGSGSEAIGAMQAGWDEVIGVELEREYVEIAKARLAHWMEEEEELPLLAG